MKKFLFFNVIRIKFVNLGRFCQRYQSTETQIKKNRRKRFRAVNRICVWYFFKCDKTLNFAFVLLFKKRIIFISHLISIYTCNTKHNDKNMEFTLVKTELNRKFVPQCFVLIHISHLQITYSFQWRKGSSRQKAVLHNWWKSRSIISSLSRLALSLDILTDLNPGVWDPWSKGILTFNRIIF